MSHENAKTRYYNTLALRSSGKLIPDFDPNNPKVEPLAETVLPLFQDQSSARGLFELAICSDPKEPVLAFWQTFALRYLTDRCLQEHGKDGEENGKKLGALSRACSPFCSLITGILEV